MIFVSFSGNRSYAYMFGSRLYYNAFLTPGTGVFAMPVTCPQQKHSLYITHDSGHPDMRWFETLVIHSAISLCGEVYVSV